MNGLEIVEFDHNIKMCRFECDEIAASNLMDVKKELFALVDDGDDKFVLNFRRIRYVYSDVLEMLINFQKKIKKESGELILCELQPVIQEIFATTRLDSLFRITDSEDEALQILRNGGSEN